MGRRRWPRRDSYENVRNELAGGPPLHANPFCFTRATTKAFSNAFTNSRWSVEFLFVPKEADQLGAEDSSRPNRSCGSRPVFEAVKWGQMCGSPPTNAVQKKVFLLVRFPFSTFGDATLRVVPCKLPQRKSPSHTLALVRLVCCSLTRPLCVCLSLATSLLTRTRYLGVLYLLLWPPTPAGALLRRACY